MAGSIGDLLATNRTLVMGVLNLTPDSFSGDGLLDRPAELDEPSNGS